MSLEDLLALEGHGPDTFVGRGHPYPWGGLYGGHIVAQALVAATHTVDVGFVPHSVRAYFIRRGDNSETVRYEVDRIRNGRSFATRRVVSRQSVGAILNLEASFQVREGTVEHPTMSLPEGVPMPADIDTKAETWMSAFEQKDVDRTKRFGRRDGSGQLMSWYRTVENFGGDQLLNRCALAYLSDDLPTGAVINAVPGLRERWNEENAFFSASLDHTIWFHRDVDMTQWHLFEMNCHGYGNGRGLAVGWVFAEDGTHVATVAQETLVRLNDRD
ncbi:MAG: acyl-CoA thioesterase [Acidimicrobiales bacterium]